LCRTLVRRTRPGNEWEDVGVLKIHWFLPTGGDARDVLPTAPNANPRAPDLAYLAQVAQACDHLGYDAMLTPCGTGCEDAWLPPRPCWP